MMRAISRFILFGASLAFAGTAGTAQQAAPALQKGRLPSSDQKNGTGAVPPGVTLVPQMPEAGAAKPFLFPKAATKTLPNGLRVFVVSDSSEPAVTVRLVIPSAGSILDPAGKPGVAQMAASLLTQGTAKRSAREIAEAIDFVGGSLNANVGEDATAVTLEVVKKDLNTGLDLMSDVVLHPAFREDEIERQRQQLLSGLTVQYSDPDYLASLVLRRVVYGNSPYGRPAEGTPATVKSLQREDFVKFHDGNYAPNQALLGFAGDISPESAFAIAEKYFGAWPKSDAAAVSQSAVTAPAGSSRHIWLIDKPGAVQTQIRVGKISIRRADPDYLPLELTNHIFGGGYNSRLNTEVRVKKGLTYNAFSTFAPHRYAGSLTVGTYTRTEATVEVTKLVLDLLDKMAAGDVTQKELDFARDYLSGVYPIQSETAEQVDDRVLTAAVFDLPEDYNRTYPEKVRAITLAQVQEMAQRYFTTKNVDIVLAGDASAFRDALKKEFPNAQIAELRFDEVDVLSPDLRESKQSAAAMTPESAERGKEILLAAARAAGEKLASIKTLGINESGKLSYPQGDSALNVKWMVSYPDRSRGDVTLGDQKIIQVCDGTSAWLQFAQGTRDTTPVISEFKRGISLFGGGWGLYQQALAGKLTGQFIGETEIDGKKTLGVAVEGPFGPLKLYFYPDTHLLAAARFQSAGPRGATDNEQRWSDYRQVEGLLFAFSTVTYRDGAKFFESTIQDVQLNPAIDEALFAKPQTAAPAASQ
jgi:zinc protease